MDTAAVSVAVSVSESEERGDIGGSSELCGCGKRTVIACRNGCFGGDDCDCNGTCTGLENQNDGR
jgi:hypothetical protein